MPLLTYAYKTFEDAESENPEGAYFYVNAAMIVVAETVGSSPIMRLTMLNGSLAFMCEQQWTSLWKACDKTFPQMSVI